MFFLRVLSYLIGLFFFCFFFIRGVYFGKRTRTNKFRGESNQIRKAKREAKKKTKKKRKKEENEERKREREIIIDDRIYRQTQGQTIKKKKEGPKRERRGK